MAKSYDILPATLADIRFFFGDTIKTRCRSWVVHKDGRPVAIAGLQHIQDGLCIFSKILDDADLPKMTIWRAAVDISHRIRALGYPVIYAVASDRIKGAPAFIKRFGLQSCGMSEKGELFIWNQ